MKQEIKILLGIGIVTAAILFGAIFLLGQQSSSSQNAKSVDQSLLIRENSNKLGSDSAKIKFVEFGDLQCPACGQAYPVVKRVISDYNGKILFVFRNFPLSIHQNSQVAAEAAEAAGAQGKYWEMNEMLYQNQGAWSASNSVLDVFTDYAKTLKLDTEKFKQDVKDNKFAKKIQDDTNDGVALGVNATPTFYLNGKQIVGVPSYDSLKKEIDNLLK